MESKIRFTKNELKCLEHLRIVYDRFNQSFSEYFYDNYIPIGLAVIHFVHIENRYVNTDPEYHCYVNKRYLEIAKFLAQKLEHNPEYVKLPNGGEYNNGVISQILSELLNGKDDNYYGILVSHIAYDNIIDCINATPYLSSEDRAIAIINEIQSLVKSKLLKSVFTRNNNILYYSVKNLTVKKEEFHELVKRVFLDLKFDKSKVTANDVWGSLKTHVRNSSEILDGLEIKYDRTHDAFNWESINGFKRKNSKSSFHSVFSKVKNKINN